MLKAIGDSNDVLQTHRYTFAQGRDALNILIKEVRVNKGNWDNVLHGFMIGKTKKTDNHLSTDHQFAKGVYKIQSGIENKILPSGKWACVRLQKTENNGHYGCDIDDSTKSLFITKKIKIPTRGSRKQRTWKDCLYLLWFYWCFCYNCWEYLEQIICI